MLIKTVELVREAGAFFEQQPFAFDALGIETVRPEELPGWEGPACKLKLVSEEGPVFLPGTFDDVIESVQHADEMAAAKLQEIRQLLAQHDIMV